MNKVSTYVAFIIWGMSAFMSQPNIASLVIHLFFIPVALVVLLFLSRSGS